MNTPAHLVLNVAALGKDRPKETWWWIGFGAVLPDLALFVLVFTQPLNSTSLESLLTTTTDIFNSIPLFVLAVMVAWSFSKRGLTLLCLSALLHIVVDFPLHNADAHRHLYPLTDWVFVSPISFWDIEHYGGWVGALEGLIFIGCFFVLWRRVSSQWGKVGMLFLGSVYVVTFAHFISHAFVGS